MKKSGFTLVEMLAIVAIIGILLLIVIPGINTLLKRQDLKLFEASMNGILREATNYYNENALIIDDGECINVTGGALALEKKSKITSGEVCFFNGVSHLKAVTDGKHCAIGEIGDFGISTMDVCVAHSVSFVPNNYSQELCKTNHLEKLKLVPYSLSNYNSISKNIDKYCPEELTPKTFVVENESKLKNLVSPMKKSGVISYTILSGVYTPTYGSAYNPWNLSYAAPIAWDNAFNETTIISEDTIYNVSTWNYIFSAPGNWN